MNKTLLPRSLPTLVLTTLGLLFFSLCAFPLQAQIPHLVFHAELSGSEAIPAVNTDGKALVTLLFTPDRKKVDVSGMFVRTEGTVTEAKIHLGITGETGPVLLDLFPLINGRHIRGQLDVPPILLQNLLVNGVYAEIKTTAHPNGEIRGQFVCETDLDYGVDMTGDQALPPNNSTARVFGGIHFPLGASDVLCAFVVRGLSGPITSAGIYDGPPDQVGTKVASISGFFGNIIQSLILLDTIDPDFLRKAREGKYHVVISTANYPNGEVRGQIKHLGYFASLAPVNGVQQIPPPSPPTPGFGFSHTMVNGTLDSLTTNVFINGIFPTSVKIHIGNPGQVGPVLTEMGGIGAPGYYSKTYPITEAQLTDFAQNRLYVNVTTNNFPNGELRGVMKNTLRKAYAYDLCGLQVVPPTNSDALGIAVSSVDQANCYLNYKVIADGLSGAPTDGYFAIGGFGLSGVPFHSVPNTEPIMADSYEIMTAFGDSIEMGRCYLQIGTAAYPDGEIRGQVRRGFTCPEVVAVTDLDQVREVVVSPVPFRDLLNIQFESSAGFEGRLVMRDILGVMALTQAVQIVDGGQTLQVQTGQLPKGIYTLSLESPNQNTSVLLKKVVKVE
jgi:hypothetical protein